MILQKACNLFLFYSENIKKLSPHSIKAYKRDLENFQETVNPKTIVSDIDRKTLHKFVDAQFSKELSHATVKRRLACLKALFKWLEGEEVIEDSPFRKFDVKIRLPQRLPRNLSVQELNKLLNAAKVKLSLGKHTSYQHSEFNEINKASINNLTTLLCIELLFTTGVRVGELTEINLSDIYLQEQYIHIKGKGQRERRVFITDKSIKNLIKYYMQARKITLPNHTKLLVNSLGKPATTQTVRIWLKKCGTLAKLTRPATPHMYRHSTATKLLCSGVDIIYVQKLLGHQSISTTQIYAHIKHDDVFRNITTANIREEIL